MPLSGFKAIFRTRYNQQFISWFKCTRSHSEHWAADNRITSGIITSGHFEDRTLRSLCTPAEQSAIAAVLSDMDAELAALEAKRDKTRALKQGMMQELLTGRIRLV